MQTPSNQSHARIRIIINYQSYNRAMHNPWRAVITNKFQRGARTRTRKDPGFALLLLPGVSPLFGNPTLAHLQEIDNVMQVLVQVGRQGVVDARLVVLLRLCVAEAFRVDGQDGLDLAQLEQEDFDLEQLPVLPRHRVCAKRQLRRGLHASRGAKP